MPPLLLHYGCLYIARLTRSPCLLLPRGVLLLQGRINCLQADAVRVVTGGSDLRVRVSDIMSGGCVQSLEGHAGAVVGLQFDSREILSVGADGELRRWAWGEKGTAASDVRHIYGSKDSIPQLARKYGSTVKDIMTWNDIKSKRHLYSGRQIVVSRDGFASDDGGENDVDVVFGKMALERHLLKRHRGARAAGGGGGVGAAADGGTTAEEGADELGSDVDSDQSDDEVDLADEADGGGGG